MVYKKGQIILIPDKGPMIITLVDYSHDSICIGGSVYVSSLEGIPRHLRLPASYIDSYYTVLDRTLTPLEKVLYNVE